MHLPIFVLPCVSLIAIVVHPAAPVRAHSAYEPTLVEEVFLQTESDAFSMGKLGMKTTHLSVVFELSSFYQLCFTRSVSPKVVRARSIVEISEFSPENYSIWCYFIYKL